MSIVCPVKSHPDWKSLVNKVGEDEAYFLWNNYEGKVPLEVANNRRKSITELRKEIGIPYQINESNIPNILKKISNYNTKNQTSHSVNFDRVGQSQRLKVNLVVDFTPYSQQAREERAEMRSEEGKVFKNIKKDSEQLSLFSLSDLNELTTKQLSFQEIENISNMIVNKLFNKKRPFTKRNKSSVKEDFWYNSDLGVAIETANSLLKNIIGKISSFPDIYEAKNIEDVKKIVKDFIYNTDLVKEWEEYIKGIYSWGSPDEYIEKFGSRPETSEDVYTKKLIIEEFLRRRKLSLEGYSNFQQNIIKEYLPSLFRDNKYKSDKQALYLAGNKAIEKINNELYNKKHSENLFKLKKNAALTKYTTLLNLSEVVSDYKQRIVNRVVDEIDRRVEFRNREIQKNPNIINVLKFRDVYKKSTFMNEQFSMMKKVENREQSDKIDKLFDIMNYYAEVGEYIAESTTVDILNHIIELNSEYKDLAKSLLPFAKKHNISIQLLNKGIQSAGKYNVKLGQEVNKEGEQHSFVKSEEILIDYTSVNYQIDPERLLLHEIIHSLSTIYIESEKYKYTQKGKKHPITKYMEYVQKQIPILMDKSMRFSIDSPYGFTNESEFIAEAMTNPFFIDLLKEIPAVEESKFRNAFEEILTWVAKLFNIQPRTNAYEQLRDITYGIINHQSEFQLYSEIDVVSKEENIVVNQEQLQQKEANLQEYNKVKKAETMEEVKAQMLKDFDSYYPQFKDLLSWEKEMFIDMMSEGEINTYC